MRAPVSILPLELRSITFEAGGKQLLKAVSCRFESEPRTVIIGPNGAGKSLALRICHGLIEPTSGDVIWHGANGLDPARHQAMVFQRPTMLRRSAAANVEYALAIRGVARAERRERVAEALARTGLRRFENAPARVLSFGEQQRLALARVWALQPQVLFLDEPTANLDPAATHAVEEIIQAFHDAGTRVIMTTHDLGQAQRLADEILFLHRGRLFEKASAETFFSRPENDLAQAFIKGELLWWKRKPLIPPV